MYTDILYTQSNVLTGIFTKWTILIYVNITLFTIKVVLKHDTTNQHHTWYFITWACTTNGNECNLFYVRSSNNMLFTAIYSELLQVSQGTFRLTTTSLGYPSIGSFLPINSFIEPTLTHHEWFANEMMNLTTTIKWTYVCVCAHVTSSNIIWAVHRQNLIVTSGQGSHIGMPTINRLSFRTCIKHFLWFVNTDFVAWYKVPYKIIKIT